MFIWCMWCMEYNKKLSIYHPILTVDQYWSNFRENPKKRPKNCHFEKLTKLKKNIRFICPGYVILTFFSTYYMTYYISSRWYLAWPFILVLSYLPSKLPTLKKLSLKKCRFWPFFDQNVYFSPQKAKNMHLKCTFSKTTTCFR